MRALALKCIVFVVALPVFAFTPQAYDVELKATVNEKEVAASEFVLPANQRVEIAGSKPLGKDFRIQLVATDFSNAYQRDSILMRFTVTALDQGEPRVVAQPQAIVAPGRPTTVIVADPRTGETVTIELKAVRR